MVGAQVFAEQLDEGLEDEGGVVAPPGEVELDFRHMGREVAEDEAHGFKNFVGLGGDGKACLLYTSRCV